MQFSTGTILGFIILSSPVLANLSIGLPHVKCEECCPRGMFCTIKDTYCQTPGYSPPPLSRVRRQALSKDGKCGPDFGGALCDPNSTTYNGTCCSPTGWCGNTVDHCGPGCVSGCTTPSVASAESPATSGSPSTNGKCGRDNGGTTCVGWPSGQCCSMYGWCGQTSHCGEGCQSGPCTGTTLPNPGPVAQGPTPVPANSILGLFTPIGRSGVPAMHAGLLPNGRVVFLDKVENYTELQFPDGRLAYSAEYDPDTNTLVPLAYMTNAFCSGGTFLANGDFVSLGGNGPLTWLDPSVGDGFDAIRYLSRSSTNPGLNGRSWTEPGNKLASARWYASAQTLADGRVFVASGSLNGLDPSKPENNNPTYEILDQKGISSGKSIPLAILFDNQPYYMYPFMHLLRDGTIFIFTSKSSQIFDIDKNNVVKSMPDLAGLYRTYPNTGGSVLLPLTSSNGWASKIMVCGGGSYQDITSPTDPSCGVISPEDMTPAWEMDAMPEGRGMVEGVLLPDGKVLWLNGANQGAQGFLLASNPTTTALLYDPAGNPGKRWSTLASSPTPRLYHSVALLLLDGTVLISGSNPNEMPVIVATTRNPYITDFSVERYTPPYLIGDNAKRRPTNINISIKTLAPGQVFTVEFDAPTTAKGVKIVLYYGGFVTHSLHMGHRMLELVVASSDFKPGQTTQNVRPTTPPNKNICPPGPYVLYVVVDGVPGVGQFVMIV